jgi:hypothetical protein
MKCSICFGDWGISKDLWLKRSQDLTLPDFLLKGLLNGKISMNKPCTIDDPKDIYQ